LSTIYLSVTGVLLVIFLVLHFAQKKDHFSDELVFFSLFGSIAFLYSSYNFIDIPFLDLDQLNAFYAILISVIVGMTFYALFSIIEALLDIRNKYVEYAKPTLLVLLVFTGLFVSGGVNTKTVLPQTLPNGFFEAYYQIINERLPFTYATVSPPIDNSLAKNRHYFMNYEFFLNNYDDIDSTYQEYLALPKLLRPDSANIPSASIFIFVEKPPYKSIQQGILFQPEEQMAEINKWVLNYSGLPNREVRVYKETFDSIVYEIINQKEESYIGDILMNIYPSKEGRAAKIFK
jgi:hypothetical protein